MPPSPGVRGRPRPGLLVVPCLCLALAACATADREDAAADAATGFLALVASGDGGSACELLVPVARQEVEKSADASCAEALPDEELPEPGAVVRTDVYGSMAQVVLAGDTVFLTRSDGAWLVLAAGCTARGDLPYDCEVSGG